MRAVAIAVVGTGVVGSALVSQLLCQAHRLKETLNVTVKVLGIANSRKMFLCHDIVEGFPWKSTVDQMGESVDLNKLTDIMLASSCQCNIVVDCTATDELPQLYHSWMSKGLHIVTPNKKFGAGSYQQYSDLCRLSFETGKVYMCEATVGAGLPVISTLQSLLETGDYVHQIEGVLSGTLSFLFNSMDPDVRFSDVVIKAKEKGFTEPDPREDLSGMDVARKVLILARKCGLQLEMEDVEIGSLVPEDLTEGTISEFMSSLPKYDDIITRMVTEASAKGEVVRYVGRVDVSAKKCTVGLARYPRTHPFATLRGSDNMIVFTSNRYSKQPLVIVGPGAGAEVTAAGVFGDIIQVIKCSK